MTHVLRGQMKNTHIHTHTHTHTRTRTHTRTTRTQTKGKRVGNPLPPLLRSRSGRTNEPESKGTHGETQERRGKEGQSKASRQHEVASSRGKDCMSCGAGLHLPTANIIHEARVQKVLFRKCCSSSVHINQPIAIDDRHKKKDMDMITMRILF